MITSASPDDPSQTRSDRHAPSRQRGLRWSSLTSWRSWTARDGNVRPFTTGRRVARTSGTAGWPSPKNAGLSTGPGEGSHSQGDGTSLDDALIPAFGDTYERHPHTMMNERRQIVGTTRAARTLVSIRGSR